MIWAIPAEVWLEVTENRRLKTARKKLIKQLAATIDEGRMFPKRLNCRLRFGSHHYFFLPAVGGPEVPDVWQVCEDCTHIKPVWVQ